MENFQRDFLWGCMGEKFKFTLVKWNVCCTPICVGGSRINKVYIYIYIKLCWVNGFGDAG